LIDPSLKKKKTWRLPQIEGFILKYSVPPLWPTYKGERRTTFAKSYGIKVRCYMEPFGEHVKNLGNFLFLPHPSPNGGKKKLAWKVNIGQFIFHTKHNLKETLPLPPNPQEKKGRPLALSLHDMTSHWLHGNYIPKIGCHYFWSGLIALPKNTLPIYLGVKLLRLLLQY
jgi:hypothetical protein